jgi:hypothetical protein
MLFYSSAALAQNASTQMPRVESSPDTHPTPNSVFFEGLGSGVFYSINYERRFLDDLGVRVGFSYFPGIGDPASGSGGLGIRIYQPPTWIVPITASYLGVRSGKHALELGGGPSVTYATGNSPESGPGAFGSFLVGYRLHPIGGAGFQLRVGVMGLVGRSIGLLPWGYLSMGAGF